MYDRILLPVDDSESVTEIHRHTAALAQETGAAVQVLFVADATRESATADVVGALEREGEAIVDDVASTFASRGVDCGTDVVRGSPAETIVEYAERNDYELIVLPTHARSGLSRYLLGSVTEKVVRLSSVPVLTARLRATDRLTFPYERVLVPTDGSDAALHAARHALELAASLDAAVHVLSVVDDRSLGPDIRSVLSTAELEQPARDAIADVAGVAESYDVPAVHTHVEHGAPADTIASAIDDLDTDVVVMGTTGRQGVGRILLGSVAEQTVRTAPVPVITVTHDE